MKVTINIEKRYAYFIIGLLILAIGMMGVNAYGGAEPAIVGHSAWEIESINWSQITNIPEDLNDGKIAWSEVTSKSEVLVQGGVNWDDIPDAPEGLDDGDNYCTIDGNIITCPGGSIEVQGVTPLYRVTYKYCENYGASGLPEPTCQTILMPSYVGDTSSAVRYWTCSEGLGALYYGPYTCDNTQIN